MGVVVAYDASPGVQQWVVNRKTLGFLVTEQRTYDTKEEALEAATEIARSDDTITLVHPDGSTNIIRD